MTMKREWRTELKRLGQSERKLHCDYGAHERNCRAQIRSLEKQIARGWRAVARELGRIEKRRAILQGRLG